MNRRLKDNSRLRATRLLVPLALVGSTLVACPAGLGLDGPSKSPNFGALPLCFEADAGTTGGAFSFVARGRACNFFLGPTEVVLVLTRQNAAPRGAADEPGSAGTLAGALPGEHRAGQGAGVPGLLRHERFPAASAASRETRELRFEFLGANVAARVLRADCVGTACELDWDVDSAMVEWCLL